MAKSKRLRVFAGPNGSGKSTLFKQIGIQFKTGYFVNSDEIEKEIGNNGFVNLDQFGLDLKQSDLDFFLAEPRSLTLLEKAAESGQRIDIALRENMIVDRSKDTHSYEASLITSFIRHHLLDKGISYSFETVMSHSSKLDELIEAKNRGYKTYLYFVCIDDPCINVSRVNIREEKGGHGVPERKVVDRYHRTLNNLFNSIRIADKSYLFDNSGDTMVLIAEIIKGKIEILVTESKLPNWFIEHVANKS